MEEVVVAGSLVEVGDVEASEIERVTGIGGCSLAVLAPVLDVCTSQCVNARIKSGSASTPLKDVVIARGTEEGSSKSSRVQLGEELGRKL